MQKVIAEQSPIIHVRHYKSHFDLILGGGTVQVEEKGQWHRIECCCKEWPCMKMSVKHMIMSLVTSENSSMRENC